MKPPGGTITLGGGGATGAGAPGVDGVLPGCCIAGELPVRGPLTVNTAGFEVAVCVRGTTGFECELWVRGRAVDDWRGIAPPEVWVRGIGPAGGRFLPGPLI